MSRIEWTDQTWNPVVGCTPVSAGCANCYAARFASRFGAVWPGVAAHGKWTGKILLRPETLDVPLRWRKPRRVFVCSMSDLFHERVPFDFIDRVFAVMALCPQHTFQVLTKRPERMVEYLSRDGGVGNITPKMNVLCKKSCVHSIQTEPWPLRNVWLGTSCENQDTADERIPHLLRCPAAVRFLSCEPLLGPIDFQNVTRPRHFDKQPLGWSRWWPTQLQWIIVGGESGPKARPCHVAWIRGIVRQCADATVPCFVKQLGARPIGDDIYCETMGAKYEHPKGGDPSEWPEDLRVREWPKVTR
jgi:protein gp37